MVFLLNVKAMITVRGFFFFVLLICTFWWSARVIKFGAWKISQLLCLFCFSYLLSG